MMLCRTGDRAMKLLDYSASTTNCIDNAINDSVRLNRTITIEPLTADLVDYAIGLGDGDATENDGSTDVWGVRDDGSEWRLSIAQPDYTDAACETLMAESRMAGDHEMARICKVALGRVAGDRFRAVLAVADVLRAARSQRD